MHKLLTQRVLLTAILAAVGPSAMAQVGQIGGGDAGGGTGAAATNPGGTTEGLGGTTTSGIGNGPALEAGNFIGGTSFEDFVGAALTTDRNGNRQFQALSAADVPTATNRSTTGTPRSVPTTIRIGFSYPQPAPDRILTQGGRPAIQRVASYRPEFQSVSVSVGAKGVATLTGSVPTTAAQRLAANLVRLQPGIRKVDNKLAVVTAGSNTILRPVR